MGRPVLRGPNGEEFVLKVDGELSIGIENNIVIKTAAGAVNDLLGTEFNIDLVSYTMDIAIKGMTDSDYPSDFHDPANVTSHNDAYAYELKESSRTWGLGDGYKDVTELDVDYGGISETNTGIISSLDISKVPSAENNADHWQGTMEFVVLNISFL